MRGGQSAAAPGGWAAQEAQTAELFCMPADDELRSKLHWQPRANWPTGYFHWSWVGCAKVSIRQTVCTCRLLSSFGDYPPAAAAVASSFAITVP